ncbi:MAG: DUF1653 domain-containing protein [Clostridia bacterium]|nr:DUF1653 domain-containing protein [Clostridia bacterium]
MEIKKGIYKHFKGGVYRVIGIGKHSESLEEMVVYQSTSDGGLWIRPACMWDEKVQYQGETVLRFQLIDEEQEGNV